MAAYLRCSTIALFGSGKTTRMQPFDSLCSMIEGSDIEPKVIVAARDELKESVEKLLVFDLDGTLIDSRADLAARSTRCERNRAWIC